MDLRQHCGSSRRRQLIADSAVDTGGVLLNGLDFLEVIDQDAPSEDLRQRLIDVVFIRSDGVTAGGAPLLTPANFVIAGGVRVVGVQVTDVVVGADDRTLRLTVDRAGDFSLYELTVTTGGASTDPPNFIDPPLSKIAFSFKTDCETDFDCKPDEKVVEAPADEPPLNYLVKDYDTFRQAMLDRMATTIPDWTERSPADLGVTLVELLADAADQASYFQDAVGTEAHLPLARLRASIIRHARLLGYRANEGRNARTAVAFAPVMDRTAGADEPPLIPAGTKLLTTPPGAARRLPVEIAPDPGVFEQALSAGAIVFETLAPVRRLRTAQVDMRFHDWGDVDCCLPKGATVAHLVDPPGGLDLEEGDLIVIEERIPTGGGADDPADPAIRQLVRLSAPPKPIEDQALGVSVLEIRWRDADALRFSLNLSYNGTAPAVVANGNIVLADEGRTVDYADPAPEDAFAADGAETGLIHADAPGAAYRPCLNARRLARAAPYAVADASTAIDLLEPAGEPEPAVSLTGGGETWTAKPDLLASDRFATEFKVEPMSGDGVRLLFGNGVHGRGPDAGTRDGFKARIRESKGLAGNVGADALAHLIAPDEGLIAGVRNPIPAVGARARESDAAVKIAASRAFRAQKRAVTLADYVAAAEAFPGVQRVAAERRYTGSWSTVFLAVDRLGGLPVDAPFEADLRAHLEGWRLAGHDLEITPPINVGLNLKLIVCARPDHVAADVERALRQAMGDGYDAMGAPGFFHQDNFSFGDPVRLSALIARAMVVSGVLWVGLVHDGGGPAGRFERMDRPGVDFGAEGEIPIGRGEVARLDNDPDVPELGRLELDMRGGR